MTTNTLLFAAAPAVLLAAFGADLIAQTPTHFLPASAETHEGNGTFNYPFGRDNGGMQTVIDGASVTSQPVATIAGLYYRHDGENFANAWVQYNQHFIVKMTTVPTTPQTMVTDPTLNYGGVTPVQVFSGQLNILASNAQPLAPRPFDIFIPTGAVAFDPSMGNLLIDIQVDTANISSPPDYSRLDSVLYRASNNEGDVEAFTTDCENASSHKLRFIPSNDFLLSGGSIDATLTSRIGTTSTPGLFPAALLGFGVSTAPIDLSAVGMNGCWWSPTLDVTQILTDPGTGFPAFSSPIPTVSGLTGATFYGQAFGLGATLADSVTSEAYWLTIGPMPSMGGSSWPFQSIFSREVGLTPERWYISNAGPWAPVMGFAGSL